MEAVIGGLDPIPAIDAQRLALPTSVSPRDHSLEGFEWCKSASHSINNDASPDEFFFSSSALLQGPALVSKFAILRVPIQHRSFFVKTGKWCLVNRYSGQLMLLYSHVTISPQSASIMLWNLNILLPIATYMILSRGSGPLVSLSFDHNSIFSLCPFFFLFRDQSSQSVHRDSYEPGLR
jgi:hypothetical protein